MAAKAHSTIASAIPAQVVTREEVEHLIEDLIAFLDDADGDPDLEPSLGWTPYCADASTADLEGGDVDTTEISDLEFYGESDGLEHGEADPGDYDANLHIPGGGYHL